MSDFVSRAGAKLAAALREFHLDVTGQDCADLGCSTGGFTDCLLQQGAAHVFSVDTGYGVLDWKLRRDSRVTVLERTNALHVQLPRPVDLVTVDVGWTPQHLILPSALRLVKPTGHIISLLKPHYEAPRSALSHGVVRPDQLDQVVQSVLARLAPLHLTVRGLIPSPILGEKGGNQEYLLWITLAPSV